MRAAMPTSLTGGSNRLLIGTPRFAIAAAIESRKALEAEYAPATPLKLKTLEMQMLGSVDERTAAACRACAATALAACSVKRLAHSSCPNGVHAASAEAM